MTFQSFAKLRRLLAAFAVALPLTACAVYEPYPASGQARYDQSWAAATDAMYDQGLTITTQDRSTGVIRGTRGDAMITATLQTRPDGRVEVKFDSSGASGTDSGLIDRVVASYNRRMGR